MTLPTDQDRSTHLPASSLRFSVRQLLLAVCLVAAAAWLAAWVDRAQRPTKLLFAAHEGDLATTSRMLQYGVPVNIHYGEDSPLILAAEGGHLDVVESLVAAGAKVTHRGNGDRTALHCSASEGHVHVVRYLLSQGAKRDAVDDKGYTAADLAAYAGFFKLASELNPFYKKFLSPAKRDEGPD